MMSSEARRALEREMTERATERDLKPQTLFAIETVHDDVRRAPWLGEYLNESWEHLSIEECRDTIAPWGHAIYDQPDDGWVWIFVDKSGWGREDEPALSHHQTCQCLAALLDEMSGATLGVGIVDEGQFQCHLGLYVRKTRS